MELVEPIRNSNKISQIKNLLKGEGNIRDLLLFELGINSALRISDLLSVKVGDVFDDELNPNQSFVIKETKTGKKHRVTITPKVQETLKLYKNKYNIILEKPSNYVFFNSKSNSKGAEPITRMMAWKLINKRCADVGLIGNYGGHTLRKTRGYQARKNGIPLEIIQNKLNHSSLSITKRYLGITTKEIEDACNKLDL